MDAFTYQNQLGRKIRVMHPMGMDGDRFSNEIHIGNLPITAGSVMEYVFDFGDWWEFKVQLETIEPLILPEPIIQISSSRKPQLSPVEELLSVGEVLDGEGEAPPQYPDNEV